jgi:F-type H+-transporting ATPase subunit b
MDIQFPQILFQLANFSVVAIALTVLLYKPIQKILRERALKVEEGQKAADAAIEEKLQLDELKQKVKKEAEKEAAKIVEEAMQTAQARKKEFLADAKNQAKAEIEKMRQEFMEEQKTTIKSLKTQFADAVVMTASKVLGEELDKKKHAKLIDTQLDQMLKAMA